MQTLKVLATFLEAGQRELAGVDVAMSARLASGTLYPILRRLEEAGWLSSRWEELNQREEKRPRRRYYSLTAIGAQRARAAMNELIVSPHPVWAGALA